MKIRAILTLTFLSLLTVVRAQDDRVLMKIDNEDVTVQQFLNIYNKNNTNNVVDRKTMNEYVELFVNFKLKVLEAESLGMDTVPKFVTELSGYRRQLAQPYLIDRQLNDQLIKEAYDRMTEDVAAYHLLIMVPEDAPAADTLKALRELEKIAKRIHSEEDMLRETKAFTTDGNDKTIGEDLGYFTAFSMVYPFETAAYNTPVGSLSKPVRTRFGYHLVFVHGKRPARGEIRVSHLFIRSAPIGQGESIQPEMAEKRIREIYQRIQNGESFDQLVLEYSEDKATASKGGTLPWFGTGGSATIFEETAFSLNRDGDISEPIQSAYGWHIIRREELREVGTFDELKATIKKRIERDSRGLQGRQSLLKKLKEEYAITYNLKNRDAATKLVSNDYLSGSWKLAEGTVLDKPVLTIADHVYSKRTVTFTQQDFLNYVARNQRRRPETDVLSKVLSDQWDGFVNAMIIQFEDENLEVKYPDFKALMEEYHDGILLFDLMDQKVWSRAGKDTAGLMAYFETHRDSFMWDERVDASVYICANDQVAAKVKKLAAKRVKKGYSDSDIIAMINESDPLNLSIRSGLYTKGEDEYVDKAPWAAGMHALDGKYNKPVFVQVYKVVPKTQKSLQESRGLVTSAYQQELERQWIEELREKYPVVVYWDVFNSIKQ